MRPVPIRPGAPVVRPPGIPAPAVRLSSGVPIRADAPAVTGPRPPAAAASLEHGDGGDLLGFLWFMVKLLYYT